MLNKKLVFQDRFIGLPDECKLIYFYFKENTGKDGFVCDPELILKLLGKDIWGDTWKILVSEGYVILADGKVCVLIKAKNRAVLGLLLNLMRADFA